jgi:2-methylcitrate dehydratase PrpD
MKRDASDTFSYTRALAELAVGVDVGRLRPELVHEAGRVLFDCIGCAVAGTVTPTGRIVLELVDGEHGRLEATAIGAGTVSLGPAAFANAMLTNAIEHEVQGPEGHVCAAVAPVALAVAEAEDASGADLLAALIAGLEVGGRVGRALRGPARAAGTTGAHAQVVLGAAAAAGRLLRLSPDQMHHALGIAGYSATVPTGAKYQRTVHTPMIKNNLGTMAQSGIQSARLAQRGFAGDLEVLEGDPGFWQFVGAPGCDWDEITNDLGSYWTAAEVWYKPYPSALNMVSALQLLARLAEEHKLEPGAIEHVEVRSGSGGGRERRAEDLDPMNIWRSLPYLASAALYRVRPYRAWQEPATFRRPDVIALMNRIEMLPLEHAERSETGGYADGWSPVRVTIETSDQRFEGSQDSRVRMTDAELSAKFRDNTEGLLDRTAADEVERLCMGAEMGWQARDLGRLLRLA